MNVPNHPPKNQISYVDTHPLVPYYIGAIHKGYPTFWTIFCLPTYQYPSFSLHSRLHYEVPDFHKPRYLPKNFISFMDIPLGEKINNSSLGVCFFKTLPSHMGAQKEKYTHRPLQRDVFKRKRELPLPLKLVLKELRQMLPSL